MARSKMVKVDFTNTSALEPGNSIKIFTLGGAISGNCAIGDLVMAMNPKKTIANDNAIAKTGLFMKFLNMIVYFILLLFGVNCFDFSQFIF
jgi:hypothetical protein